eukprot:PLAT10260.1.p1 GENE.PLAT10260.1~~PLAT10260.1.p1  ORF type:complete len:274 (+),score=143.31 PLAT10260.1:39-824(+)
MASTKRLLGVAAIGAGLLLVKKLCKKKTKDDSEDGDGKTIDYTSEDALPVGLRRLRSAAPSKLPEELRALKEALKGDDLSSALRVRDLASLNEQFKRHASYIDETSDAGRKRIAVLGLDEFSKVMGSMGVTDSDVIGAYFRSWDQDGNGWITLSELIHALATLALGTQEEKLELLFAAYDLDGDGFITRKEMAQIVSSELTTSGLPASKDEVASIVNQLFVELDVDHNNVLTKEEFMAAAMLEGINLGSGVAERFSEGLES